MKRVFCPRCDNYVSFDETKYCNGESLQLHCTHCGRNFGIKVRDKSIKITAAELAEQNPTYPYGRISMIENFFGYKQEHALVMGDNVIGRRSKGNEVQVALLSDDPSMGRKHCVINVKEKEGHLIYTLRDFPSVTGTYHFNTLVGKNEQVLVENEAIITMGATTIILYAAEANEHH